MYQNITHLEHQVEHLEQEIRDLKDIIANLQANMETIRWQMHESSEGNE